MKTTIDQREWCVIRADSNTGRRVDSTHGRHAGSRAAALRRAGSLGPLAAAKTLLLDPDSI